MGTSLSGSKLEQCSMNTLERSLEKLEKLEKHAKLIK